MPTIYNASSNMKSISRKLSNLWRFFEKYGSYPVYGFAHKLHIIFVLHNGSKQNNCYRIIWWKNNDSVCLIPSAAFLVKHRHWELGIWEFDFRNKKYFMTMGFATCTGQIIMNSDNICHMNWPCLLHGTVIPYYKTKYKIKTEIMIALVCKIRLFRKHHVYMGKIYFLMLIILE